MAVYRVVFYKSLIFKTSKNKFYRTFQFAIFVNTILKLDCKTVGFFLKIGKACCKSLTRAKHASLSKQPEY